jgi:hypothetical protein
MLQNAFGGLQGIVDHVMVGNFVGTAGNAAIGVSWQIFLVVMVFVSSLFTGMAVLVARFAGADDPEKVNRTVAQAMITAAILSVAVWRQSGGWPRLRLDCERGTGSQAEALLFLRLMFVASIGMMFFARRRAAKRVTLRRRLSGVAMTVLNIVEPVLIPGWVRSHGRHTGAAIIISPARSSADTRFTGCGKAIKIGARYQWAPDWTILRCFIGLPQAAGRGDERGGRDAAPLHRLARAERRGPGGIRGRLHGALLADHLDVGRSWAPSAATRAKLGADIRSRRGGAQPPA